MKRLIALFVICCVGMIADEQPPGAQYTVTYSATLASAAGVVTVQQPATGARNVQFVWASVFCSVTCYYTMERDGTAAANTAATVNKINSDARAATAAAFTASDAGSGTVVGHYGNLGGGLQSFNLDDKNMHGNGTGINFTIRTGSLTGDVKIVVAWKENNQ